MTHHHHHHNNAASSVLLSPELAPASLQGGYGTTFVASSLSSPPQKAIKLDINGMAMATADKRLTVVDGPKATSDFSNRKLLDTSSGSSGSCGGVSPTKKAKRSSHHASSSASTASSSKRSREKGSNLGFSIFDKLKELYIELASENSASKKKVSVHRSLMDQGSLS